MLLLFGEFDVIFERLGFFANLAFDFQFTVAAFSIAADQDQLLAREQVEIVGRVDAINRLTILFTIDHILDFDVSQNWCRDLRVEITNVFFQILIRSNVLTLPVVFASHAIQQAAVDVKTDAEANDTGVFLVLLTDVGGDFQFIGLSGGGQPVGQEQNVCWAGVFTDHIECSRKGTVDVRAASGVNAFDISQCSGASLAVVGLQFGLECLDIG